MVFQPLPALNPPLPLPRVRGRGDPRSAHTLGLTPWPVRKAARRRGRDHRGPHRAGGRGSTPTLGSRVRRAWGPGIPSFFCGSLPPRAWGSLGLLLGERETGVRPASCGLPWEFRTRRPLPPTRAGLGTARVAGEAKGVSVPWGGRARGLSPASPPSTPGLLQALSCAHFVCV